MRAAVMIIGAGSAILGAAALAGCGAAAAGTPATGHPVTVAVTGRFVMEGGPSGEPPVRPLRGTVTFAAGHRVVTATALRSGQFSVRLAPGTYRAYAVTLNITGPGGRGSTCSDPSPVRVSSRPVHVTVACIVP